MGFKQIFSVGHTDEALNELGRSNYGIVISDWSIPDVDGISLLRTIREDPELKDLIFIIITAEKDRNKVIEAKDCGVDAFIMKPFTAELLCRHILDSMKSRYSGAFKPRQSRVKGARSGNKQFSSGASSRQTLLISQSHENNRPRVLGNSNLAAMINVMSLRIDSMKADREFVSVKEFVKKLKATTKNAERQAVQANLITGVTQEIDRALAAIESVPVGSPESIQGLNVIDQNATKLAELIDAFEKEASDVICILNDMEHSVQQAHVNEINESIKASFDIEMNREGTAALGASQETREISGEVADGLAGLISGSETARESLTTAAGGMSHVIKRSESAGPGFHGRQQVFQQLHRRIDHIMGILDGQIALAYKLGAGMDEVATVQENIIRPGEPVKTGPEEAGQQDTVKTAAGRGFVDRGALKKIWEYRILVIDIITKEHGYSIRDLGEMLRNNTEIPLQEHLPGHPECSLSKWIEHCLAQPDYYGPRMCRQVVPCRDDMYLNAVKVVDLFKEGKKDDAWKVYRKVEELSGQIEELLKELQEHLRKKSSELS